MPPRAVPIDLDHVVRRFGAVVAVADVSLSLRPGEVHAIVGENGAGKSTALKLAAGALAADAGVVRVGGTPLAPATPREAIRRGVGMVHQHFMLVGAFTGLENVMLGVEPAKGPFGIDPAVARARAEAILREVGLAIDLDRPAGELPVGDRQRIEILRVLYRDASAILLDEPTAVLTAGEARELYATLRKLALSGHTVAVVTHKLDEVLAHSDRVSVMRRGRLVLARETAQTSADELTRAIMGGEPPGGFSRPKLDEHAPRRLSVEVSLPAATPPVEVSITLRRGEIVGVAGVEGNGQRELVRALAGLEASGRVQVELDGAPVAPGPRGRRSRGLAVVHEDRHEDGLLLDATVADNLVLGDLGAGADAAVVSRRLAAFDVRPPDPGVLARALSGGNQQKVVVARALDRDVSAAVLAQPTRGVDLGSARVIHDAIARAAAAGASVLVVSSDLAELRALSHRILVLSHGRIVAELAPDADDELVGRAMLGLGAAAGAEARAS